MSEFEGQTFDFVITVCDHARETCPWLPGAAHRVHKSFEDPAAATPWQQPAKFREVGEQIRAWVEEFVRQQS